MYCLKKVLSTGLLFLLFATAHAQQNRIIPVDEPAYEYISLLQYHGYMLDLNPTSLPYAESEVINSLQQVDKKALSRAEKKWFDMLNRAFRDRQGENSANFNYGLHLKGGSYISNSRRENTLRPLDNKPFVYPSAALSGYMERSHFIANFGLQHSLYYDRDPDGLDAANRLYVRSEDAYIGYNSKWLKIYFGRYKNQWAPYGETSTILSANPHSFDQVDIRVGSDKFSWRAILGELDNISADSMFTGNDHDVGSKRRYVVAHRFDWRPGRHFGIALFESILYSGVNSGFSFKYFNPLHVHSFLENAPKNDEMNLMLGSLIRLQGGGFTLNAQLLLDDLQVEKTSERNNYAISSSLHKANLFPYTDLGIQFEAVSHEAYIAHQPEGRYVYLKRGLATQFNDYIKSSFYFDIYRIPNLMLTPKLQFLWQGEQSINQFEAFTYPNGEPLDYILTGTEEQTIRPSLSFHYQPNAVFWIEGDAGVNFVQDYQHQPGVERTRFSGMLSFGFDFSLVR